MRYSDFITLQDYFHPVFNLQNEANGYWEKFIPTSQFNTLLEKTLDAVSSNIPANRKSVWVQGTARRNDPGNAQPERGQDRVGRTSQHARIATHKARRRGGGVSAALGAGYLSMVGLLTSLSLVVS